MTALARTRTIAVAFLAAALAGCYNSASEYRELAERSILVEGRVYSLECRNHGQYWYEFYFEGKQHIGASGIDAPKDCRDVRVGMKVTVHLDPQKPNVHTLAAPEVAYRRTRGFYVPTWAFILIGFPVVIALQIWRTVRRSKQ